MYKNINSKPYSVHKFSTKKTKKKKEIEPGIKRATTRGTEQGARVRENGVKSHKLLYMTAK